MTHARTQHPNASLTPRGRRKMVTCVIERGWTIEQENEVLRRAAAYLGQANLPKG